MRRYQQMFLLRKLPAVFLGLVIVAILISGGIFILQKKPVSKDQEIEDIYAACLQDIESARKNDKSVYFVSFRDDKHREFDPSDEFITRFKGSLSRVAKGSEGISIKGGSEGVRDRVTQEVGAFVSLSDLTWISPTEVTVGVSDYYGNLGASWSIYTLNKVDGVWKVNGRLLKMVS